MREHTTVPVDIFSSHHCNERWVTPLIDKQPVEDVEHAADGVASQLFTSRHYRILECHFERVVIRQVMKLNSKNNTRTFPAATTTPTHYYTVTHKIVSNVFQLSCFLISEMHQWRSGKLLLTKALLHRFLFYQLLLVFGCPSPPHFYNGGAKNETLQWCQCTRMEPCHTGGESLRLLTLNWWVTLGFMICSYYMYIIKKFTLKS